MVHHEESFGSAPQDSTAKGRFFLTLDDGEYQQYASSAGDNQWRR